MKVSSNLVTQLVSFVLWVLAINGLQVQPDQVAGDLVTSITTANYSLLIITFVNLGNVLLKWYQTIKGQKLPWLATFYNPQFWVNAGNIVAALLMYGGITLAPGTTEQVVALIFNHQWRELAGVAVTNLLFPILQMLIRKPSLAYPPAS